MAGRVVVVLEVDDKNVVTAFQQVTSAGEKLGPALQKSGTQGNVVMTALRGQTEQAHDAARLLARTFGVEMPRQLDKFLARSSLIGPILSSAFNVAIVAAFGMVVLSQIPKIVEFSRALGGMTEEFKALEESARKASNAALLMFSTPKQGMAIQGMIQKKIEELKEAGNTQAAVAEAVQPGGGLLSRAVDSWFGTNAERAKKIEELAALGDEIAKRGKDLREGETADAKQAGEKRLAHEKTIQDAITKYWEMSIDQRLAAWQKEADAQKEREAEMEQAIDAAFDAIGKRRDEAAAKERSLQDENVALAIQGLQGEERVNAELTAKIANLEEVKRQYAEFPNIVANATGQEIVLQENAAAEIISIRRRQAEQMARDWQMAVHHMAMQIERFLDNPIDYLKNLWKRFLANMVAEWIVSTRMMSGAGTGGAAQSGGFSLGGLLGGLFGVGNGGGGGFSLPSGSAGGMQLPPGVNTTFPSGGRFQFGQFTPGVAGLARLPFGQGGGAGAGNILATGATVSSTAKLSMGAQLAAIAPMLIAGGGALGASKIGFGGPGRGALAGGLLGFAGALGGTMALSGASLSSILAIGSAFWPIGLGIAAIAAIVGALFGMSNRNKQKAQAQQILDQGRAEWKKIISDFESHRMDYGSAVAGVTQVWQQMVQQWSNPSLGKYGGIAIQNNAPEFRRTLQQIEDLQTKRQWTAQSPMFTSAGEFSSGGFVQGPGARGQGSGFGPLGIPLMPSRGFGRMPSFASGGAVPIIAHSGEFVMQRSAVQRIGRGKLEAMNSGSSRGGGPMIVVQGPLVQAAPGMSTEALAEATIRKLERLLRDQGVSLRA